MAALRNAVSPDFTYSQSYLSLLSASGCMAGIICCASPSLILILRKTLETKELLWRSHVRGRDGHDLEKESEGETDTDGDEERWTQKTDPDIEGTFAYVGDGVNKGAVALIDFGRSFMNELTLRRGQLLWIHGRRKDGWLLAENLFTNETGLVPEDRVRFLSTIPTGMGCEN